MSPISITDIGVATKQTSEQKASGREKPGVRIKLLL